MYMDGTNVRFLTCYIKIHIIITLWMNASLHLPLTCYFDLNFYLNEENYVIFINEYNNERCVSSNKL